MSELSRTDLLTYEVAASWWAGIVGWTWGKELAARWFAWKVKRKHRRYAEFMRFKEPT